MKNRSLLLMALLIPVSMAIGAQEDSLVSELDQKVQGQIDELYEACVKDHGKTGVEAKACSRLSKLVKNHTVSIDLNCENLGTKLWMESLHMQYLLSREYQRPVTISEVLVKASEDEPYSLLIAKNQACKIQFGALIGFVRQFEVF